MKGQPLSGAASLPRWPACACDASRKAPAFPLASQQLPAHPTAACIPVLAANGERRPQLPDQLALQPVHLYSTRTRQRDALPALAAVGGVQQDGGLAHDPALVAVEGDGVEAEVEALVLQDAWVEGLKGVLGA